MDDAARRRRADHYLAMAHATYDLADLCDDAEMLRAYVEIAGRWFLMADDALRTTDPADRSGASPQSGFAPGEDS